MCHSCPLSHGGLWVCVRGVRAGARRIMCGRRANCVCVLCYVQLYSSAAPMLLVYCSLRYMSVVCPICPVCWLCAIWRGCECLCTFPVQGVSGSVRKSADAPGPVQCDSRDLPAGYFLSCLAAGPLRDFRKIAPRRFCTCSQAKGQSRARCRGGELSHLLGAAL